MDLIMDQTNPPTLLDLPRELLHSIILECRPADVAAIRGLCHSLKQSVDGDTLLFREIYLKHYVSCLRFGLHGLVIVIVGLTALFIGSSP